MLRLVIPALGRPRQDDRTFVPVGLIPSKYTGKRERTERAQQEGGPTHWTLPRGGGATVKFPRPGSRLLPGNPPGIS